ncbi:MULTISPECIES: AMP-binding protein [unclassified Chelatococcus]|uniref:class I adenylate-forming enzyme family protein n=1 Tax=unclassified Chelatococcus TaxID=2638111 RepID=UPI001BCB329F|nr:MULTISPECIES: AMP-binding protein [unclassified Chelatococcus]MBS7697641.1 AMP-binding protein [Chelatococcus sp. YT9]MBX3559015.1 AMP-binding protein [Chelatococcus sp.]
MLLIDHFEKVAREAPDRVFIHFVGDEAGADRMITYAAAAERAAHLAAHLRSCGVKRGDPVAILMPNSIEWLVIYFACQKIGAIAAGLNTDLLPAELQSYLDTLAPRVLVTAKAQNALALDLASTNPGLAHIFSDAPVDGMKDAWSPSSEPVWVRDPEIPDDALLSIVFTSGTTGAKPKAALQRSSSIIHGIAGYQENLRLTSQDRVMLVTPLLHGMALNWGTTMCVLAGCTMVLARRFSASRFWDQADRSGASVLWTMGAVIAILLTLPPTEVERRAVEKLRILFANGAAGRWRQIRQRWGCDVLDGYGMTETPGTLAGADCYDLPDAYPCVGRPVRGVDLRIVNPDTGVEVGVREVGEITARFGQGFAGYFNNEAAFREVVRDGWFHTGDLAYRDEENRFFFVDRLKSIIRRGGENIASLEIENCIVQHPEIREVIALPQPHDVLGETVLAVLIPMEEGREFSVEEIRHFCEGKLAPFKWPEAVRTSNGADVPRTETGRVKKLLFRKALGLIP